MATMDPEAPVTLRAVTPVEVDTEPDFLLTPFEAWCERQGIHPEAPLAWFHYERTLNQPA